MNKELQVQLDKTKDYFVITNGGHSWEFFNRVLLMGLDTFCHNYLIDTSSICIRKEKI